MKTYLQLIFESKVRKFVTKAEAQAKLDKLPPEEREKRVLRNAGQRHGGWGMKMKDSLKRQRVERKGRSDVQTDPSVKKKDYSKAVSDITSQGKEAHHNVPLDRASELFKGKTTAERQKIRDKFAEYGVYFGNDPRNLSGLSAKDHRGEGGAHRQLDAMDKSINPRRKKESDRIFDKIRSLGISKKEKERKKKTADNSTV